MSVFALTNFAGGLNSAVPRHRIADNEVSVLENMLFRRTTRGAAVKRNGYTKLNTVESPLGNGKGIRGLYKFFRAIDGTEKIVIAAGTDWAVYNSSTSAFDPLGLTLTDDLDTNFVVYNNLLIGVNGVEAPQKYDGTTAAALGGSPPVGSVIAIYKDRVFMNDSTDPNVLKWSALENPENWTATDNAGSAQVGKGTEDVITALVPQQNRLLIFKNNSVWALTGRNFDTFKIQELFPRIGCITQKASANLDGVVSFVHASGGEVGIYAIDRGTDAPTLRLLSLKIDDNLQTLGTVGFATAAMGVYRRELWTAYTDTGNSSNSDVFWYGTEFNAWSKFSNMPFSVFFTDNKTGTDRLLAGDAAEGFVYTLDTGTQDVGAASTAGIVSKLTTKFFDFGIPHRTKRLRRATVITDHAKGDTFEARTATNGILNRMAELKRAFPNREDDSLDLAMTNFTVDIEDGSDFTWALEIVHRNNSDFTLHEVVMDVDIPRKDER